MTQSGRTCRHAFLPPTVTLPRHASQSSPPIRMSLFTKKPTPGGPLSVLARPPVQPKKPVVVVTTRTVQVAQPARSRPPAKASSASAASSSSSRPEASSSFSSSSKRKPAAKSAERPHKVRKTSIVKKVAEQRVLPESDSSGDDDDAGLNGRDRSPSAEELVVARNVVSPSVPVSESWKGLITSEGVVKSLITKYKPCWSFSCVPTPYSSVPAAEQIVALAL